MKRIFVAFLLVATGYIPANAVSTARDYPGWKASYRFQLSSIDGYQKVYGPHEPIVFYVEGRSDKVDVKPANGFYVAATLYDIPRTNGETIKNAVVKYDSNRNAWQVKLKAPKDSTKTYEIQVHLYCGEAGSACAGTYGLSAQVEKILPLQVR